MAFTGGGGAIMLNMVLTRKKEDRPVVSVWKEQSVQRSGWPGSGDGSQLQ